MRHLSLLFLLFLPLLCGHSSTPFAEDLGLVRQGKDYALFFPVSTYSHPNLTNLPQSVPNATSIARELESSFGFQTEIVPDATFAQMTAKLKMYQQKFANGQLPADGQLFIYFSGHGMREFNNGYFLPADANPNSLYNTGLGYSYWRQFISNINCQHIMVAVDACYSVTFDPDHTFANFEKFGRKGELTEKERILANHEEFKSRIFFSSDSKEDKTPGRSNFARKLLQGLRESRSSNGFITSSQLFSNYVALAQPPPRGADFEGDDPSATFLFFHKNQKTDPPNVLELNAWHTAQQRDNCSAYQAFLREYPAGDFALVARRKFALCKDEEQMFIAWETAKERNDCETYASFGRDYPKSPYADLIPDLLKNLNCELSIGPNSMVLIKGGTFQMGDTVADEMGREDEKPIHYVTLSDFYLAKNELSVSEFDRFIKATQYQTDAEKNAGSFFFNSQWINKPGSSWRDDADFKRRPIKEYNHPVLHVSWYDAIMYCNWLSREHLLQQVYSIEGEKVTANWEANGYRLPTEAEWEYAARSRGEDYLYAWGNETPNGNAADESGAWGEGSKIFRNYNDGYFKTAPVGSFPQGSLGLSDMTGNVWEWCWDWYAKDYYASSTPNDPRGPNLGVDRVIRGGSWCNTPNQCRVSNRSSSFQRRSSYIVGFRLARSAK